MTVHDLKQRRISNYCVKASEFAEGEVTNPEWMVDGVWVDESVGFIAGEPKTRKSWVAIDLAISVATGTAFLDTFEVKKPGPVLYINEEGKVKGMKQRLRSILMSKNLLAKSGTTREGKMWVEFPDYPLYLRNFEQFTLDDPQQLEELMQMIGLLDIKLLILDSLQFMLGSKDENRASELRPVLVALSKMHKATGCSIIVVHHYHKSSMGKATHGGQRMMGSTILHGWLDCAMYLEKDARSVTRVLPEFRDFDIEDPFEIEYLGGEGKYEVQVHGREPKTWLDKLVLTKGTLKIVEVAESKGKNRKTLERMATRSSWIESITITTPESGRVRVLTKRQKR